MNRRRFLQHAGLALTAARLPALGAKETSPTGSPTPTATTSASFFLIGDTHLLADEDNPSVMDEISLAKNQALVDTLNRLPGTDLPENLGGGKLAVPQGLLHVGDLVDSGDKNGKKYLEMQKTEWASHVATYGLNGTEGRLKMPCLDVAGNHDSPGGGGYIAEQLALRQKGRPNLDGISENGLHYSWTWGGVHFIALGLIVGTDRTVARKRRYGAMDSLDFLRQDLTAHPAKELPLVIMHHVDIARYTAEKEGQDYTKWEWDPADVKAFHAALAGRKAVTLCGHTHRREILRWDGNSATPKGTGIPTINVDNSAHFHSDFQAFFHIEANAEGLTLREHATKDGWKTGFWTPQLWKLAW